MKGTCWGFVLNPFGKTVTQIRSSATGIVIGMTTAPAPIPGTAMIHIARLRKTLSFVERSLQRESNRRHRKRKK